MDLHSTYHESSNPPWVENGDECEESSEEESRPDPFNCSQDNTKCNKYPTGWQHCRKAMQTKMKTCQE